MDPLTHTLTGLVLSRAGLKRLTPYATPLLLLAANAPDLDIVTAPAGAAAYLHYHRGITHAFAAIPFMALLPVLAIRLFARKPFSWKWAYLVSLLGVASHPLLDWTNSYGIRLLMPFSSHWYHLDFCSLADAWIWTVLLAAISAPLLARLVSSEIGAKPGSGRGAAIAALCFLAAYPFARWSLHERALAVLDSRIYDGAAPLRVAAVPTPFNPFRWRGIVETSQLYSIHDVNLLMNFDPAAGAVLYKPEPNPAETAAAAAARRTKPFQSFLDFAQYPIWQFSVAEHPEDAIRVEVQDLRFAVPPARGFLATAVVGRDGRVLESSFHYDPPGRNSEAR